VRSQPDRDTRRWQRAFLLTLLACALIPLFGRGTHADSGEPATATAHEWPQQWDSRPLRPLAMTAVERRFAAQFPGHIGRFDAGDATVVLRDVRRPTRMLHPAADCFRGLGYSIRDARLERDARQRLWRCFTAQRDGHSLRVCERIEAAGGEAYTDTSAWFWAATLGQSTGPWLAVTRVAQL